MSEIEHRSYSLMRCGSHSDLGMYWVDRWIVHHAILELSSAYADVRTFLLWSPVLTESYPVRQREIARAARSIREKKRNLREWIHHMVSLP